MRVGIIGLGVIGSAHAANLYWAARVTFVNEFALVCKQFGASYENVRAAWLSDPRMTSVYTKRAGYPPGFDGRCWPKDLAALIAASSDAGYYPTFLGCIQGANERFRGQGPRNVPEADSSSVCPDSPFGI
jgi:UDP-glucose 6-dehydrogenase